MLGVITAVPNYVFNNATGKLVDFATMLVATKDGDTYPP